jgi:hypothetical protein
MAVSAAGRQAQHSTAHASLRCIVFVLWLRWHVGMEDKGGGSGEHMGGPGDKRGDSPGYNELACHVQAEGNIHHPCMLGKVPCKQRSAWQAFQLSAASITLHRAAPASPLFCQPGNRQADRQLHSGRPRTASEEAAT